MKLTTLPRLTSDIYPGDLGWAVNWDKPEERQEWYHNMSSVMQAGPCVRSNQLDYDEDVMHKVRQTNANRCDFASYITLCTVLTSNRLSSIYTTMSGLTRSRGGHLP
jgi:hypothetical protein